MPISRLCRLLTGRATVRCASVTIARLLRRPLLLLTWRRLLQHLRLLSHWWLPLPLPLLSISRLPIRSRRGTVLLTVTTVSSLRGRRSRQGRHWCARRLALSQVCLLRLLMRVHRWTLLMLCRRL